MTKEISDEAKRTLADIPRRKALQRLERDGAQSTEALQRRVRAIAAERKIPPADFAKLMYKRISTFAVLQFCKKHKISIDWLLCGDLKGLQRMTKGEKRPVTELPTARVEAILQKLVDAQFVHKLAYSHTSEEHRASMPRLSTIG